MPLWALEISDPSTPSIWLPGGPPRPSAICAPGLLGSRQPSSPAPPLLLPTAHAWASDPFWHLLNEALFSTTGEGGWPARAALRGAVLFHPKMPACWAGRSPSPLLKELGKHLRGAGCWVGSGPCAHPDHCVCAKVSHSVGTVKGPGVAQQCQLQHCRQGLTASPPPALRASSAPKPLSQQYPFLHTRGGALHLGMFYRLLDEISLLVSGKRGDEHHSQFFWRGAMPRSICHLSSPTRIEPAFPALEAQS